MTIIGIECNEDHAHLLLSCLPTQRPSDIMFTLKRDIGNALRTEFTELSKMPNLWTRKYLVSTEEKLDAETIRNYVQSQRNTGKSL